MLARERIERIVTSVPFRLVVAVVCLAIHLRNVVAMGEERFGTHWNSAPDRAPTFIDPKHERDAHYWNRLAVARWDAGHYTALALRGYTGCPDGSLRGVELHPILPTCNLPFYPGYPALAYVLSVGARLPIDYTLFGISIVSSLVIILLWTSRWVVDRLGLWPTYCSLLLYNAFPAGFSLVMIMTEPVMMAFCMGAFFALERRWYVLGALLAGAASGIRVTGTAATIAYALALLVATMRDRPATPLAFARRGLALVLSGWGVAALLAYFKWRFDDPFVYFRAHEALFSYKPEAFHWQPGPMLRALDKPLHDGWWLILSVIFLLLGLGAATKRFDLVARVYWYVLTAVIILVPTVGTINIALAGMSRYLMPAIPLFFAMAMVMARRPVLLGLWLAFSAWHYWQADLCFYASGPGPGPLTICNDAHWVGRD